MGNDKRSILLSGETLFNRALGVLKTIFQEVIVVLGEGDFPIEATHIKVVHDIIPNRAAAGGLYTGLFYAKNPRIFVVACDMPFLNPEVIRFMASLADEGDIHLAQLAHGPQTMHGIYSKRCLPVIEKMVKEEKLRLQELIRHPSLQVQMIPESDIMPYDPDLLSFMNLNSPADLELAKKIKSPSP